MMKIDFMSSMLMIVDDDPSVTRLVQQWVEKANDLEFAVETYCDSEQALRRLNDVVVDVLLTDLEMPNMDGVQLLQQAKKRNALTQVLLLTGHSSQEALLNALEMGASDYLLKPIRNEDVLDRLREAQARKRRWTQALCQTWESCRTDANKMATLFSSSLPDSQDI